MLQPAPGLQDQGLVGVGPLQNRPGTIVTRAVPVQSFHERGRPCHNAYQKSFFRPEGINLGVCWYIYYYGIELLHQSHETPKTFQRYHMKKEGDNGRKSSSEMMILSADGELDSRGRREVGGRSFLKGLGIVLREESPQTPLIRNVGMSSAATEPKLYIPAGGLRSRAENLTASKPEQKAEGHFWTIGARSREKSDRDWIVFLFFGLIALAAVVSAFATLFHFLNTDALTHFVETVLR